MNYTPELLNKIYQDVMMPISVRLILEEEEVQLVSANTNNLDSLRTWYKDECNDIHSMGPSFGIRLMGGRIAIVVNGQVIGQTSKVKSIREEDSRYGMILTHNPAERTDYGFCKFRAQSLIIVETESGSVYTFLPTWAEIDEGTRTLSA